MGGPQKGSRMNFRGMGRTELVRNSIRVLDCLEMVSQMVDPFLEDKVLDTGEKDLHSSCFIGDKDYTEFGLMDGITMGRGFHCLDKGNQMNDSNATTVSVGETRGMVMKDTGKYVTKVARGEKKSSGGLGCWACMVM